MPDQQPNLTQAQKVLEELVQTEITYLRDLETLSKSLDATKSTDDEKFNASTEYQQALVAYTNLIRDKFLKLMFNSESYSADTGIIKNLSSLNTQQRVEILDKIQELFQSKEFVDIVRVISLSSYDYLQYLNAAFDSGVVKDSFISSLAIKPIQRLAKYPLLFKELKSKLESDGLQNDNSLLKIAANIRTAADKIAQVVNDNITINEQAAEFLQSQKSIKYANIKFKQSLLPTTLRQVLKEHLKAGAAKNLSPKTIALIQAMPQTLANREKTLKKVGLYSQKTAKLIIEGKRLLDAIKAQRADEIEQFAINDSARSLPRTRGLSHVRRTVSDPNIGRTKEPQTHKSKKIAPIPIVPAYPVKSRSIPNFKGYDLYHQQATQARVDNYVATLNRLLADLRSQTKVLNQRFAETADASFTKQDSIKSVRQAIKKLINELTPEKAFDPQSLEFKQAQAGKYTNLQGIEGKISGLEARVAQLQSYHNKSKP